jgi:hypothetical protein
MVTAERFSRRVPPSGISSYAEHRKLRNDELIHK